MLEKLLLYFTTKDKKFLPLFSKVTKELVEMANTLDKIHLKDVSERDSDFIKIGNFRNTIENMVQNINLELCRNFITPFDREDIYTLSKNINDLAGYINSTSNKMHLYKVEKFTKSINKLTASCLESCLLIDVMIQDLPVKKKHASITEACDRIYKLERKSDNIYEKAVYDIFDGVKSIKDVIKYKEVLSALENAMDKSKSVANIIELIIVKNT